MADSPEVHLEQWINFYPRRGKRPVSAKVRSIWADTSDSLTVVTSEGARYRVEWDGGRWVEGDQ